MSEGDTEVERLRREVERATSAVRVAVSCAIGAAVAAPLMFVIAVPEIMRPQWLAGNEVVVALWAALFLLATVGAWVLVTSVRRRVGIVP